jgi:hypothetical protein
MRRREFITLLGGAAAGWPLHARAQQPGGGMHRIGVLMAYPETDPEGHALVAAFRDGLRSLDGWRAATSRSKFAGPHPTWH